MSRRILITNLTLASRTGTELYVRDVARELLRRGHRPIVFTPAPGAMAEEIRDSGVEVVSDLAAVREPPDIIHGHHYEETFAAVLSFPSAPAIFICHDAVAKHDDPPLHSRVRRHLAVSNGLCERLLRQGAPADGIRLVSNFVDMSRFVPRRALPAKPARVLVFSNYASRDTFLPAIAKACRQAGLELDVIGSGVGRSMDRPEEVLGRYDIVFAKGKAALEALAVGAAVVLCDLAGLGPTVTSADFDRLRGFNFGLNALTNKITCEGVLERIARYDSADATRVSARVRAEAGLDRAVDNLLSIYDEVIAEHAQAIPADAEEDRSAAVALIGRLLNDFRSLQGEHHMWGIDLREARQRLERLARLPVIGRLLR